MQDNDTEQTGPDRLLWPREAAEILDVDPKTVSRWAREGKVPSVRTPGGHRRFREREVRALRDACEATDLNTLVTEAGKVAEVVTFDFRGGGLQVNVAHGMAWFRQQAETQTPAEALAVAVAELSAYLADGQS